jgi:hypothetical protein
MFCVVGTHVRRYSNNSGVDGLEQENFFEFGIDVELVLTLKTFYYKKRFLGSLKKQLASWKPHQRISITWSFFTINNNQSVNLKQGIVIW